MGSPSRNVQYHPPRLSEDRLNLPQPHSPSLPTHCSGKSGMRPYVMHVATRGIIYQPLNTRNIGLCNYHRHRDRWASLHRSNLPKHFKYLIILLWLHPVELSVQIGPSSINANPHIVESTPNSICITMKKPSVRVQASMYATHRAQVTQQRVNVPVQQRLASARNDYLPNSPALNHMVKNVYGIVYVDTTRSAGEQTPVAVVITPIRQVQSQHTRPQHAIAVHAVH